MKKSILSVILVASGLFSGCSSEESVSRPETVGQTGTLTFSFPAPRQSITYAIGDATEPESAVPAIAGEIEINDVTVYMFKNSGVPDEETLVARKTASADEASARSVTFDVNDFATGSDNYLFYAVANASGNFTDNFVVGSTTLDDFTTAVTTDTGAEPIQGSHMLMAGYVAIDNLSTQTDPVQTIHLRHRVARFDIDNLAADDDPNNDNLEPGHDDYNPDETFFEITKIHVINTQSSGYLTAEDNTDTRPDLTDKASLKGDKAIDVSIISGINEVPVEGAFYLWPGKLADKNHYKDEGSTAIEVEGIYSGDNNPKVLTVLLESEKYIDANKRYTLKVQRINQTTLTFSLIPSGWGDGDEVIAKPATDGSFIYGGVELLAGGAVDSTPVENNTVDLSANTGDNELRFYTEGESNGTSALTAKLAMTLGTGYASNVISPVPDGEPVVTYSIGKVRQYYKIILPKTTYPIEGTLTIKDEKTELYKELAVTSVPKYENTDYEPVLVEGDYGSGVENRYWAPVNVGATSITYEEGALAGCGYIFQWGRNVPFTYNSVGDTYEGPVTAETPVEEYENKFIITSEAPNDWLSPQDNALWSGEKAQGPCPNGWKIPTEAELLVLKNKLSPVSNNCVSVTGVGGALYLPAAGYRNSDGSWIDRGVDGSYWSSTVAGTGVMRLTFNGNSSSLLARDRSRGYSVRCLQK
ncbi:MAG: FimB/Mfa2 family fimbrial subunit [Prevotella sp.]|jgi:hypothetical protein|nr:FimB/Mfa2 family fimbrial subunit [Prevotella sp.]